MSKGAYQREHWSMRVAAFLGHCAGHAVDFWRLLMPTRLLRYSAAFLAMGLIARYTEFYMYASALSFMALVFAVADILIDEFAERVKGNGA